MENRIDKLFETKKENVLSIFFTAGYPKINDIMDIVTILNSTSVDILEIGIPFSDPIADGPIIQESSQTSLNNGMTLKILFNQLKSLRSACQLPILLMGYINSVMQFGIEEFYKACDDVGIDGVILPDLPLIEFELVHKALAEKYNIRVVLIISPETSTDRIRKIDNLSSGFLYLVSSNSTTGNFKTNTNNLTETLKHLDIKGLKNPTLIGFGIKGNKEFAEACSVSNGAIIGSSFVKLIGASIDLQKDIPDFVSNIKLNS